MESRLTCMLHVNYRPVDTSYDGSLRDPTSVVHELCKGSFERLGKSQSAL